MSRRQSSTGQDYPFFDRITDAALIASLYTVLPFSPLRMENFVSDKHALLGIFTLVILAIWLIKLVQGWRPDWSIARKHPLMIGVVSFIIVSLISTVFSLNPMLSWVGKTQYPNGLLTFLMYAILMLQTIDSIPRIRTFIAPMLVLLITVQLVWSALIDPRTTAQWLFATAGNPNYLSTWLVMTIFVLAYELYSHWMRSRGETNPNPKRGKRNQSFNSGFYYRLLLGLVIILAFVVMLFAGGRGALLALLVASVGTITMLGVLQRRFRLVFGVIGVAAVLLIGFIGVSSAFPEMRSYLRVLRLGDANRYTLWAGGVDTITHMNEPLEAYRGNQDSLSFLRPIIGYGPDTVFEVQSRWGREGYFETHSRLSFHNHLLDSLVERGIFGTVASLMIFGSVIYLLFKELNWISKLQLPFFLGLGVIMAIVVTGTLSFIAPEASLKSFLGVGIGLSFAATIYLWAMLQEFRRSGTEDSQFELTPQIIFLIFMANLVIAHWIDIQFAFGQPVSEPLFWVILGWIIYRTLPQSEIVPEPVISTSQAWLVNIVLVGLHLIHLKNNVHFSNLQPSLSDLSLMFTAIFIVGGLGFWLSRKSREKNDWLSVGIGIGLWLVLAFVGSLMNGYLTARFDATGTPISVDILPFLYIVATASSLVLCAALFLVWMLPMPNQKTSISRFGAGVLVIVFVLGSAIYVLDFVTAVTARHAWTYANNSDTETYEHLVDIVEKMDDTVLLERDVLVPMLYAHINYMILTQPDATIKARLDETWRLLLDSDPYFNHSQAGWQFIETYEAILEMPPPVE